MREFYTNLQPVIGDQLVYSIVKGRRVSSIREKILQAILTPNVPEEKPPFTDRVSEIPSGSFAPTSMIILSMKVI